MRTLQSELVKHRHFITNVRSIYKPEEKKMNTQTEVGTSRNTGGQGANKRYKRSPEELLADIERVDSLVASGKYNQIEALNAVGLQSSVYHYKKKQMKEDVAKSLKPRKFAPRPNRASNKEEYKARKKELFEQLEAPAPVVRSNLKDDSEKLKAELAALKEKYAKLAEYVVERSILK